MLNSLSLKFKVLTGKVNPFKIKPEFCVFDSTKLNQVQLTSAYLKNKTELNSDYDIIRLELKENDKCIGTSIGQYLKIKKEQQQIIGSEENSYQEMSLWPISRIDDCGIVDFVIKRDFSKNLNNEDQFTIQGPFTQYLYQGFGNLQQINQQQNQEKQEQQETQQKQQNQNKIISYMGVICQNQYISDAMQIIEGIATNGDKTNLSILHYCDNLDNAVFLDEMVWLREEQKLNYNIFLNEVNKNFMGLKSIVNKDQIKDYMSPIIEESTILVAGDQQFTQKVNTYLKELQYQQDQILNVSNLQ